MSGRPSSIGFPGTGSARSSKIKQESDPPFALNYRDGSDYYFIRVAPYRQRSGEALSPASLRWVTRCAENSEKICCHAHDGKTRFSEGLRLNEIGSIA